MILLVVGLIVGTAVGVLVMAIAASRRLEAMDDHLRGLEEDLAATAEALETSRQQAEAGSVVDHVTARRVSGLPEPVRRVLAQRIHTLVEAIAEEHDVDRPGKNR